MITHNTYLVKQIQVGIMCDAKL